MDNVAGAFPIIIYSKWAIYGRESRNPVSRPKFIKMPTHFSLAVFPNHIHLLDLQDKHHSLLNLL